MLKALLTAATVVAFAFTAAPTSYACGSSKTKVSKKKDNGKKPSASKGAKSSPKA